MNTDINPSTQTQIQAEQQNPNKTGFTEMINNLTVEGGGRRRSTARVEEGAVAPAAPATTDFEARLMERSTDISAQDRRDLRSDTINYDAQRMIGHGSFGAVFLAKVVETQEIVAIKKVLQDNRFKNRELQIMRQLQRQGHPFIVNLSHHFISKGSKNEMYLNLVLEYVPETLHSLAKHYNRARQSFPIFSIKVFMYQLSRALAHIHGMGICHRDIKPQNLLVDPAKHVLKLCDFGSAKALVRGEPNIAYICSRYYRAPELIFGSTDYTTSVDIWSQGCVLVECLNGTPIFPGCSGVDQLVEIIKVLGSPTKEELKSMNPNYQEFKFPQIRGHPWSKIFKPDVHPEALDLSRQLLWYTPGKRLKAIEACNHPFFNELRSPTCRLPDGSPLPPDMFNFTTEEMSMAPELQAVLIPPHVSARPYDSSVLNTERSNDSTNSGSTIRSTTNQSASSPIRASSLAGIAEEEGYQLSGVGASGSGTGRPRPNNASNSVVDGNGGQQAGQSVPTSTTAPAPTAATITTTSGSNIAA